METTMVGNPWLIYKYQPTSIVLELHQCETQDNFCSLPNLLHNYVQLMLFNMENP